MPRWLAPLLAGLQLALLCLAAAPALATRAGARGPDAVAAEFYGWYLDTLGADQDPLSDRYPTFTRYVAAELAARLVERMQGGLLPRHDYFIQAASYRPAWRRGVRAVLMRQRAGVADVLLTLGDGDGDDGGGGGAGDDGGPRQLLVLSMVLENGAWKIRQVAAVDAAASSAGQPGN